MVYTQIELTVVVWRSRLRDWPVVTGASPSSGELVVLAFGHKAWTINHWVASSVPQSSP
jgi:hypothetical protein